VRRLWGCRPKRGLSQFASRRGQYNRIPVITPLGHEKTAKVSSCVQVSTSLPDEGAAQRVATCLVEERLAACAQILGPISSTYCWRGEVERAAEWYCNLKTTRSRLPELQERIRELHPYEVPEIIALPIVDGDAEYLKWIEETVAREGQQRG
jgi:periplasmic divalent cation tolerance protein